MAIGAPTKARRSKQCTRSEETGKKRERKRGKEGSVRDGSGAEDSGDRGRLTVAGGGTPVAGKSSGQSLPVRFKRERDGFWEREG